MREHGGPLIGGEGLIVSTIIPMTRKYQNEDLRHYGASYSLLNRGAYRSLPLLLGPSRPGGPQGATRAAGVIGRGGTSLTGLLVRDY